MRVASLTEEYRANLRDDTGDLLGIVSDQYQIVQNAEAFAFTDQLWARVSGTRPQGASLEAGRRGCWPVWSR